MKFFFVCASLLGSISALFAQQGQTPQDPLAMIHYREAFEQRALYKKYEGLWTAAQAKNLGVESEALPSMLASANYSILTAHADDSPRHRNPADVVLEGPLSDANDDDPSEVKPEYSWLCGLRRGGNRRITRHDHFTPHEQPYAFNCIRRREGYRELISADQLMEAFQKEALQMLNKKRRDAILHDAYESVYLMGLMGGATAGLMTSLGASSYGGSFGVFAAMFNSIWFVREIVRGGYNLVYTPEHPLDGYEIAYAKNKWALPSEIWPAIEEKFLIARSNPFQQREAMDYIEFALGLKIYHPREVVHVNQHVFSEVRMFIARFFTDYDVERDDMRILKIQSAVAGFLENILRYQASEPFVKTRPIFFEGEGGIGKTHLTMQLNNFINSLLHSVIRGGVTV